MSYFIAPSTHTSIIRAVHGGVRPVVTVLLQRAGGGTGGNLTQPIGYLESSAEREHVEVEEVAGELVDRVKVAETGKLSTCREAGEVPL